MKTFLFTIKVWAFFFPCRESAKPQGFRDCLVKTTKWITEWTKKEQIKIEYTFIKPLLKLKILFFFSCFVHETLWNYMNWSHGLAISETQVSKGIQTKLQFYQLFNANTTIILEVFNSIIQNKQQRLEIFKKKSYFFNCIKKKVLL